MIKRIPFTEWLPDLGEVNNPGIYSITNAVPENNGYEPGIKPSLPLQEGGAFQQYATSSAVPLGGFGAKDSSGTSYLFLGVPDKIWRFGATADITDVSGTAYSAGTHGTGARWEFTQWGDDVLATNYDDPIQYMAITGSSFADVSSQTSAPKAKTIAVARNFLIVGDTYDLVDATQPQRVRWSALNDYTDWDVSPVTQADYNDLLGPGRSVKRIFGGEYAVIFQEHAIWRMTYVGPPLIWQFDEISTDRGLLFSGAAAQQQNQIFFLAEDGFYLLRNGSELIPIGEGKVNKYFFQDLDTAAGERMRAIVDPRRPMVHFVYKSESGSLQNSILVYNWKLDQWGTTDTTGGWGSSADVGAYAHHTSYGDQRDVINYLVNVAESNFALGATADVVTYLQAKAVDSTAVISSGKLELSPGRNALVTSMTPAYPDKSPATATHSLIGTVIGYDAPWDPDGSTSSGTVSGTSAGLSGRRVSVRKNGKYHKFSVSWDSSVESLNDRDHDKMPYVDVEYVETHRR